MRGSGAGRLRRGRKATGARSRQHAGMTSVIFFLMVCASGIEVVDHVWFSDQEKRTILLSWVRDELVKEQVAHKALPELKPHSQIDAVLAALSRFDPLAAREYRSALVSIRAGAARHIR